LVVISHRLHEQRIRLRVQFTVNQDLPPQASDFLSLGLDELLVAGGRLLALLRNPVQDLNSQLVVLGMQESIVEILLIGNEILVQVEVLRVGGEWLVEHPEVSLLLHQFQLVPFDIRIRNQ